MRLAWAVVRRLWQRSFDQFVVGELQSRLPLGSWVILQGSETTQILRDLAHQENLNLDVLAVNEMQVLNEGGFATPVVCVIIADTKAQSALSGCHNFKCKEPLAYVCWLCGGEPSSLFGCVWAGNLNFARGLAMGGDHIASSPPFPNTPRLWTPWGARFGALCGQRVG